VPSRRTRLLIAGCAMAGISSVSAISVAHAGVPQAEPLQAAASSALPVVHANGQGFGVRERDARADRGLARAALSPSDSPILLSGQDNSAPTASLFDVLPGDVADSPLVTSVVPLPTLQEQAAQLAARQQAAAAAAKAAAKGAKEAAAAKAEAARLADVHRWVRPNYGSLSSPFGRRWGRVHEGIDLAGGYGSAILAATSGTVLYAGPESGYGEVLKIQDWDGTQTWYGHMSKFLVKVGDHVQAGQPVALVGSAGDATGPHLHFEVRIGGVPVDPIPFLAARGVHI